MADRVLVLVLLVLHFALLGFLVFGGILAWKWPVALFGHIPLVIWGVLNSVYMLQCPVTMAENWARRGAGMPQYEGGFVETYLEGVLYPVHHVNRARAFAVLVVVLSWLGAYWLARRRAAARMRNTAPIAVQVAYPEAVRPPLFAVVEENSVA